MTTTEILKGRLEDKPGVIGASIITHSGAYFDYIDPQPDTINPLDIGWGLSNTCRFNGQSLHFYSVAQHCWLASYMVPLGLAFPALMHDAAEAYVGDMVGPLKQLCPDFKAIEKRVEEAIAAKFGLTLPWGPDIKHADLRLLRTEQRDLTSGHAESWNGLDEYPPLDNVIVPWAPQVAFHAWMDRFHELSARRQ